jgi:hypothetical protein
MQHDSLDTETRTHLWNILAMVQELLAQAYRDSGHNDETQEHLMTSIWIWEFKEPRDEEPDEYYVWRRIKEVIRNGEWFDAIDLIEAIVKQLERQHTYRTQALSVDLAGAMNEAFERCLVGYRFIETEITPVDSTIEGDAVEDALDATKSFAGARHALERAVELLSDRQQPDYPNSIKESISAVEAVVRHITGEGTLGAGLSKLEAAGVPIHAALKSSWAKMYGWTSDADGIRHAGVNAADADQALAKYMLVTCSAFVSYLIQEGQKRGILSTREE